MAKSEDTRLLKVSDLLFRFLTYKEINNSTNITQLRVLLQKEMKKYPYYPLSFNIAVQSDCKELHKFLQNLYTARFFLPCINHLEFVSYAVSNCENFLNQRWDFLSSIIGYRNMVYFHTNMCCTIIAELLYFCLERKCFKYLPYGAKAFQVVYRRYLRRQFLISGGWNGLQVYSANLIEQGNISRLKAGHARRGKCDIGLLGLRRSDYDVIEIRKQIEYSIDFFNGKIELTEEEKTIIGDFVYRGDPCYVLHGELCAVCRFDCTGCCDLYAKSYQP